MRLRRLAFMLLLLAVAAAILASGNNSSSAAEIPSAKGNQLGASLLRLLSGIDLKYFITIFLTSGGVAAFVQMLAGRSTTKALRELAAKLEEFTERERRRESEQQEREVKDLQWRVQEMKAVRHAGAERLASLIETEAKGILDRRPSSGDVSICLGEALEVAESFEAAAEAFSQAAVLLAEDRDAPYRAARSYLKAGNAVDAEKWYREAIARGNQNKDALLCLSTILIKDTDVVCDAELGDSVRLERLEEAIALLEESPTKQGHELSFNLGLAYFNRGDLKASVKDYERARSLFIDFLLENPDHKKAHLCLGTTLARLHDTESAVSQFCEALRIDPRYAKCLNSLGDLYLKELDARKALSYYEEVLAMSERSEEYAYAASSKARILRLRTDFDESVQLMEEALDCLEHSRGFGGELRVLYADLLCRVRRFSEAIVVCDEILKCSPSQGEVLSLRKEASTGLAVMVGDRGVVSIGAQRIHRTLQEMCAERLSIAEVHFEERRFEACILNLRDLIQSPEGCSAEALSLLSRCYGELGDLDKSLAYCFEALRLEPSKEIVKWLATTLRSQESGQGRLASTLKILQEYNSELSHYLLRLFFAPRETSPSQQRRLSYPL